MTRRRRVRAHAALLHRHPTDLPGEPMPHPTPYPRGERVPATAELVPVPSLTVLGHTFPDLDYGPTIGFELALEYRAEHVELDESGWPPVEEPTAEPVA